MNTHALPLSRRPASGPIAELLRREPTLARFGLLLWALLVPAAIALALDDRTLRDANVWWKPMKFLLSVGLFSLTTAWFVGLLPEARRARVAFAAVSVAYVLAWLALMAAGLTGATPPTASGR